MDKGGSTRRRLSMLITQVEKKADALVSAILVINLHDMYLFSLKMMSPQGCQPRYLYILHLIQSNGVKYYDIILLKFY